MLCQSIVTHLINKPWIFIHSGCFIAFTVQMCILANDQINPSQTETHMEEKKLDDIEFPVLFKICIKPAFNIKELKATGYWNIWGYFIGQSIHNDSIFGWAGHTKDGNVIGSVKGIL